VLFSVEKRLSQPFKEIGPDSDIVEARSTASA
jgi:hypothetical protein